MQERLSDTFGSVQVYRHGVLATIERAPAARRLKLRLGLFQGGHAAERVIGPLTVIDQNQRRLSGPPRVW
jgi:hypothetical protein